MRWIVIIAFYSFVSFSQNEKVFQLNVFGGAEYIVSYQNLNTHLSANGIDPLNPVSINAGGSFGWMLNQYDLQAEFSSTFGNNGAFGDSYAMNFSAYGLNLMFGYNLTDSWDDLSVVPFVGIGVNKMQLIGQNFADTISSVFNTGDYNLYYNNTSLQLDMRLGVNLIMNPKKDGFLRIFTRTYYSMGLLNYQWSADPLPVNGTSGFSLDVGLRFLLQGKKSAD